MCGAAKLLPVAWMREPPDELRAEAETAVDRARRGPERAVTERVG
jgi:hypothetical protein